MEPFLTPVNNFDSRILSLMHDKKPLMACDQFDTPPPPPPKKNYDTFSTVSTRSIEFTVSSKMYYQKIGGQILTI